MKQFNLSESINIVSRLKPKSSAGYDDISVDIMIFSILLTAPIVADIMNVSFSTGSVHDMLKR